MLEKRRRCCPNSGTRATSLIHLFAEENRTAIGTPVIGSELHPSVTNFDAFDAKAGGGDYFRAGERIFSRPTSLDTRRAKHRNRVAAISTSHGGHVSVLNIRTMGVSRWADFQRKYAALGKRTMEHLEFLLHFAGPAEYLCKSRGAIDAAINRDILPSLCSSNWEKLLLLLGV